MTLQVQSAGRRGCCCFVYTMSTDLTWLKQMRNQVQVVQLFIYQRTGLVQCLLAIYQFSCKAASNGVMSTISAVT